MAIKETGPQKLERHAQMTHHAKTYLIFGGSTTTGLKTHVFHPQPKRCGWRSVKYLIANQSGDSSRKDAKRVAPYLRPNSLSPIQWNQMTLSASLRHHRFISSVVSYFSCLQQSWA